MNKPQLKPLKAFRLDEYYADKCSVNVLFYATLKSKKAKITFYLDDVIYSDNDGNKFDFVPLSKDQILRFIKENVELWAEQEEPQICEQDEKEAQVSGWESYKNRLR